MTSRDTAQPPLAATIALFVLAFLVPSWPWLSGAVTVPWDAKSTFFPPIEFMARAFATAESPFWTPNIFTGWPQIADPQSLAFSPLHVVLAMLNAAPSFRAVDAITFAYLFLGGLGIILYFRDRQWHMAGALVAALAFAFGGAASGRLQHTGQLISLCYLPLTFWALSRAIDRSSWRWGLAAGALGGLIAAGRDQVALLELYVLVGFVAAELLNGDSPFARLRASIVPLIAGCIAGLLVLALPVGLTELLAQQSNRPEIDFESAGRGSFHPAHLFSLVFADLFGAMDPKVDFWGPPGYAWNERFGMAGLAFAQNMGLVYFGAVPIVALLSFGFIRGLAFAREIRVFTIAALLVTLFALGWYTPAFRVMYDVFPGVAFFRRPADAAFVFPALLAIVAGYLVHRWLSGTVPAPSRLQRAIEIVCAVSLGAGALALAATVVGVSPAIGPVVTGIVGVVVAIVGLWLARALSARSALAAPLILTSVMAADLAWNNAPHISTGLPPATFEVLRLDTTNETVALIKQKLAAQQANHRDRVELIGIGYHWPNLCLVQGCDHVLGHNPLRLKWFEDATAAGDTVAGPDQRRFSPLFPSYRSVFADLVGLRLIATGVPIEQIDKSLKPGDVTLLARTKDAYVYERVGALPRVMMVGNWQLANFDRLVATGWPDDVDPRRTVLVEEAPRAAPLTLFEAAGTARLVRYANAEVVIEVDSPSGGIVVLNDVWHPWWRATIDGIEADILRANVMFRAVQVPPGKFTLRFTFEPFRGAWADLRKRLSAL